MYRSHFLYVFHGEFEVVFIRAYSFVFGSVIHISTLDRLHQSGCPNIQNKYDYSQYALAYRVKHRHVPQRISLCTAVFCDKSFYARKNTQRQEEKESERESNTDNYGKHHHHVVDVDFEFLRAPFFEFTGFLVSAEHLSRTHKSAHT